MCYVNSISCRKGALLRGVFSPLGLSEEEGDFCFWLFGCVNGGDSIKILLN